MQEMKLLTIEHGRRVIEAQYSEGRLTGFASSVKKDDELAGLGLRKWLGDLLVGLAGFINHCNMNPSIRLNVVNVERIGEVGLGSQDNGEGSAVDNAGESIPVGSKHAGAVDFQFDSQCAVMKSGRRVTFYFSAKP